MRRDFFAESVDVSSVVDFRLKDIEGTGAFGGAISSVGVDEGDCVTTDCCTTSVGLWASAMGIKSCPSPNASGSTP